MKLKDVILGASEGLIRQENDNKRVCRSFQMNGCTFCAHQIPSDPRT